MPDLLAHALIAYSLATLCSWRFDWLSPAYVTIAMAGAFIPDLAKGELIVPNELVEATLGIPFAWFGLHTLGGTLVSIAIGVVVVTKEERSRVAALLGLGAGSHLLADALLLNPSGRSYPLLWPLTRYVPPSPGLYLSTDIEPLIVSAVVAGLVFIATWMRFQTE